MFKLEGGFHPGDLDGHAAAQSMSIKSVARVPCARTPRGSNSLPI